MTQSLTPIAAATKTQIQAADPELSVWVSASAGSGKTKVLTDRFVRLLLNGTSPHKILCLTYTQAAAAEMIERILKRLGHWAVCAEETLATELARLLFGDDAAPDYGMEQVARACAKARTLFAAVLDCPGGLRIKTFHAFAQEIIARFPMESGVVPHFTELEEAKAEAMREEALAELLRDGAPRKETRAAWVELIGTIDLAGLHKILGQILHDRHKLTAALERYGDVEALRAALYQQLQIDVNDIAAEVLAAAVQPDAAGRRAMEWDTATAKISLAS
jgi:ATP-dependent helicase/nuclease subunit A